jgi:hypothetical protein
MWKKLLTGIALLGTIGISLCFFFGLIPAFSLLIGAFLLGGSVVEIANLIKESTEPKTDDEKLREIFKSTQKKIQDALREKGETSIDSTMSHTPSEPWNPLEKENNNQQQIQK